VLQQIVEGVSDSLGFQAAILSLIAEDGGEQPVVRVAAVGIEPATWAELKTIRREREQNERSMQPRFQVSRSYFIPHGEGDRTGLTYRRAPGPDEVGPDEWHPEDFLLVPLVGRGERLLGLLSLDDPVDRRVPSRAAIETAEIFANVAAYAIENAYLFADQS